MANIRRPGNLTTVLGSVKNKIETLEAKEMISKLKKKREREKKRKRSFLMRVLIR